jgi:transcriptional regulator with XRE-family HTH domain
MNKSSSQFMIDGVEDLLKIVGENIKLARIRRKMTQDELANRIHVDKRTISRMEQGDPSINFKNLLTVLITFGIEDSAYELASPDKDEVGKSLELLKQPKRVRSTDTLNDDF